jgi:hypothetical protein
MQAAMVNPKYNPIVSRVDGELHRLGFEGGINAFAETGSLKMFDDVTSAAAMAYASAWRFLSRTIKQASLLSSTVHGRSSRRNTRSAALQG